LKAAKGKTDRDLRDNGWFVFFAPRDNPKISGVVFVEHGGHGGVTAAPIAKHVMETFFAKQEGRPLPQLKMPTSPPPAPDRSPKPTTESPRPSNVRASPVPPHRLGHGGRARGPVRHRPRDDLQHD